MAAQEGAKSTIPQLSVTLRNVAPMQGDNGAMAIVVSILGYLGAPEINDKRSG
jgi:hypothetical protein